MSHVKWALTGEAHYVLDGDVADVLLAAARTPDGIALFEVDPLGGGVIRTPVTTMDTSRAAGRGPAGRGGRPAHRDRRRPGRQPGRRHALQHGCQHRPGPGARPGLHRAQRRAGGRGGQRALELTVAHTKARVQFGQPIGGFQALQHRMADLHVLVESARALSYAAADAAADGTTEDGTTADHAAADGTAADRTAADHTAGEAPDLSLLAAAAQAYCSEVLLKVAGEMIQLHGAIGITWEHDAHRYLKRAHGAAQLFGQPAEHIARIATAVLGS